MKLNGNDRQMTLELANGVNPLVELMLLNEYE